METYLRNDRVLLRALEPEDLEFFYQMENETAYWQYGCTNVPYSRYTLRNYILENRNDIYQDGQVRLMVVRVTDHQVLGCVDLIQFDPVHLRAEVGILIHPAVQRHGYGRDALQLLTAYAFRFLHLHQLYAYVSEKNDPACKLMTAAGYRQTALLPDWLRGEDGFVAARLYQCFGDPVLSK